MSDVVARGYDALAGRYAEWRAPGLGGDPTLKHLDSLAGRLPTGARVLELGCGPGVVTRLLVERYEVTALDISSVQADLARHAAPAASVEVGDALDATFEAGSFDAVLAFYVLNHIRRQRIVELLDGVSLWLRPGGIFLASFGVGDVSEWTGSWLGTEMFFSSWPSLENSTLVEAAGLEILDDSLVTIVEGEPEPGEATFQWIMARR